MECDKVWDLLSVYADGEASPQEAAAVEAHVAVCPDCARDLQFMQSTHQVLESVPDVEPPATLRSAILAATVYRPSLPQRLATGIRKSFGPAPVRYGALAAAGAAAALTAVLVHNSATPVLLTPATPPTVAVAPPVPNASLQPEDEPVLDLLDAHRPERSPAPRSDSLRRPPVRRVAASTVRGPQGRNAAPATAAAGSRASRTAGRGGSSEPVRSEDLGPANGEASTPAAPVQPDPEPVTRLVAGAPETATPENSGMPAASPAAPSAPRIVLAASAISLDPTQVATLADLRRSLAKGEADASARAFASQRARDRQIRVDVIKGSF